MHRHTITTPFHSNIVDNSVTYIIIVWTTLHTYERSGEEKRDYIYKGFWDVSLSCNLLEEM